LIDIIYGVGKSIIQIPPFQREFVWSAKAITDLLDSIYRGYPIGSFIFWKTSKRLPYHRKIGGLDLPEAPEHTKLDYVLDGQQRITSLYAAVKGAHIENAEYEFYFDLSIGRFDYVKISDERSMKLSSEDKFRIPLRKLFLEATEYFKFIKEYPEQYQDVLQDLRERFKNYRFSVITVWEPDENEDDDIKKIVNIFSRINDTGKKLTVVAKMVAKCWGNNFDLRGRLNAIFKESELQRIREETFLQLASAILNNKKSRSRNIIDDTDIDELESKWGAIEEAFMKAIDFLHNKLRIKNLRYLPFEATIVPLAYFYYHKPIPTGEQAELLERWFWSACLSNRFGATVESKVEEDCSLFDKVLSGHHVESFNYPIDWDSFKTRLIHQKYNQGNALCNTVLCLYSYHQPKDLKTNSDIDIAKTFSDYSKHNLHHFFPRAFLEREESNSELRDSVVNIAFAPASTNQEIKDAPPSAYVPFYEKTNKKFTETLQSHIIQDAKSFGILSDDYEVFLRYRAQAIENSFRDLIGLRSKTEEQFEKEPSVPVDALEQRFRTLIDMVCQEKIGSDYWDEIIPSDVRDVVTSKIRHHIKHHPYDVDRMDSSSEKVYFLDVMDYYKIFVTNWSLFGDIFGSKNVLEKHFSSLKEYRNAVKHAKPLGEVEKKNGEAAILWFENVFDKADNK
jgi:hypothetical protein